MSLHETTVFNDFIRQLYLCHNIITLHNITNVNFKGWGMSTKWVSEKYEKSYYKFPNKKAINS